MKTDRYGYNVKLHMVTAVLVSGEWVHIDQPRFVTDFDVDDPATRQLITTDREKVLVGSVPGRTGIMFAVRLSQVQAYRFDEALREKTKDA